MTPIPQRNNNGAIKSLNCSEIAKLVDGEIIGDKDIPITGIAGIQEAKKGDITFLANVKYLPFLAETQASVVIVSKEAIPPSAKVLIRTANPSLAFNKIIPYFSLTQQSKKNGIHPKAVVDPTVLLGKDIYVGPNAVLEKNVKIGDGCVIEAGVFIGEDSTLGEHSLIYPNVTIRERSKIGNRVIIHSGVVVGSDGFGYDTVNGIHHKITHIGHVEIEDDVEIGANSCIDRGRFQATVIKKGSKIDNLVQIAHNVVIGENNLIISQAGISGSSQTGKNVVIAGQAGIVGHVTVGDNVIIGAQAGVTKSVPADSIMLGGPARPISEQKKIFALMARLPDLFKDLQELKRKLSDKK